MPIGDGGGGRNERFEALYRKYYARTYRFFRGYGVADGEAHDLAQDTFTRIYEHFDQWRGEGEWSFIETTARRVLFNWIRKGKTIKRGVKLVELDDPDFDYDPPAPDQPDYAERQERDLRRTRMAKAVGDLPEGQRECLRLWIQGFKYNEIAAILKISVDAVKSRLRDAKRHLRERLGDQS